MSHDWRHFDSVLQIFELDAEHLSWGPTGNEHRIRWSEIHRLHCYDDPTLSLIAIELHDGQQLSPAELRFCPRSDVEVRSNAKIEDRDWVAGANGPGAARTAFELPLWIPPPTSPEPSLRPGTPPGVDGAAGLMLTLWPFGRAVDPRCTPRRSFPPDAPAGGRFS